jgi:hypothetical protein
VAPGELPAAWLAAAAACAACLMPVRVLANSLHTSVGVGVAALLLKWLPTARSGLT